MKQNLELVGLFIHRFDVGDLIHEYQRHAKRVYFFPDDATYEMNQCIRLATDAEIAAQKEFLMSHFDRIFIVERPFVGVNFTFIGNSFDHICGGIEGECSAYGEATVFDGFNDFIRECALSVLPNKIGNVITLWRFTTTSIDDYEIDTNYEPIRIIPQSDLAKLDKS